MASNGTTVASSARSEEYFNELKNLIFKSTKNIRVDKFLISHIRSLAGTIKIFNADTSNKTNKFLNDNVYWYEVNSNKNKVYMSQHNEVQNEDDNMDTSMVIHNSPNKECDKHVQLKHLFTI